MDFDMDFERDLDFTVETVESGSPFLIVVWLALMIFIIAACWKTFGKAGEPGWAAIVPIYNLFVFLRIAGKPGWWLILFFIPLVNLIVSIVATVAFAEKYGKGVGFAIGLIFLPFVFYPILGFGGSQYQG